GGMEHARELNVDREARGTRDALGTIDPRRGVPDDRQLGLRTPRDEQPVRLVVHGGDEELEALIHHLALADLLHCAPCAARSTASSIFGYAPHRQMLPLIPARTSSRLGSGLWASS